MTKWNRCKSSLPNKTAAEVTWWLFLNKAWPRINGVISCGQELCNLSPHHENTILNTWPPVKLAMKETGVPWCAGK